MFAFFCRADKRVYREMYCEGNPEACERRALRMAGRPVPENLLPYGGKLWEDNVRPPRYWGE
jgi:hypothetical protein